MRAIISIPLVFMAPVCIGNAAIDDVLVIQTKLEESIKTYEEQLSGDTRQIAVFRQQQADWNALRGQLCGKETDKKDGQTNCLIRLYEQRIAVLNRGPGNEPETDDNWKRLLLPGQQIGIGGPSGSDYWAVARCGLDTMFLVPGGTLATTGRSQLFSSDPDMDLPFPAGGVDVHGDMNETQVSCQLATGVIVTAAFSLSRPITESGPCSGLFGVLFNVSAGQKSLVKDRDFLGYCGVAILEKVSVTEDSIEICSLAAERDPERNDPVNVLSEKSICEHIQSEK